MKKNNKENKSFRFKKISSTDKMFFVQNLSVLIRAGFSLSRALNTIANQTKQQWLNELFHSIAESIEKGFTFADALREHEKLFDPLFINMIQAGELSGKLENTLKQLGIQLKKSHLLYLKIRNALAYPAVILFAMVSIGTAMMIFVVPNIVDLYKETTAELPLATRIIIYFSDFVVQHGLLSLFIVIITIASLILLYKQEKIKRIIHRLL